jgi:hypothetical protein
MNVEAQLGGFIDKYTPEIAAITRACLEKMRQRLPGAAVLIYDNYNSLAVGFGPSEKASEAIFSIVPYPRWILLFFLQGAGLPDPHGLLKGTGKVVRSIRLESAEDLNKPAIRELIGVALQSAKRTIDPKAQGKLVVKSVSVKQRSRRPA